VGIGYIVGIKAEAVIIRVKVVVVAGEGKELDSSN